VTTLADRWARLDTVTRLLLGTAAVGTLAVLVLSLLDYDPAVVRVLLVVLVAGAVLVLVLETRTEPPEWEAGYRGASLPSGRDSRTAAYLRMVESNRTGRAGDPALRDRLAALTDQALLTRRGLEPDDPEARRYVGPRLRAVLDGPARPLSARELDACLDDLEAL
jgi:hypothetical protein